MVKMDVLNEPEIYNNLLSRYNNDNIYTYISQTLIMINPYKSIHKIYSENIFQEYL